MLPLLDTSKSSQKITSAWVIVWGWVPLRMHGDPFWGSQGKVINESCGIRQSCGFGCLLNDLRGCSSGLLFILDSKFTMLLVSEEGESRTLLWAWRGEQSRHFISTL